ncbi:MAG TPA: hypothetical protein VG122_08115 [Gemmata sp.]|jgi:hypothetical protein|nr:hypothetical protein [Gemmata sp.]
MLHNWQNAVETISPYVVKISTPEGSGTGFLIWRSSRRPKLVGIATAAHVVDHAEEWGTPIRIHHPGSDKSQRLSENQRTIFLRKKSDTALIVFMLPEDDDETIPFPAEDLKLWPKHHYLAIGNELGWVGFPAVSPDNLCFFSGSVSCWLQSEFSYLVDGVAINGVSGGPAFFEKPGDIKIVGLITQYILNRSGSAPSPGLSVVQDVSELHVMLGEIQDYDKAKKVAEEATKRVIEEEKAKSLGNPVSPETPIPNAPDTATTGTPSTE